MQQLTNLLEAIDKAQFAEDIELNDILAPLRAVLTEDVDHRDIPSFANTLRDIELATQASLLTLEAEARSSHSVVALDEIAPLETIHQARKNLGLTLSATETLQKERCAKG